MALGEDLMVGGDSFAHDADRQVAIAARRRTSFVESASPIEIEILHARLDSLGDQLDGSP
jgi:hypothetical protein